MKIVQIIVSPQGETAIETKGFSGNQCQKASQFLTAALGQKVNEQLKPEFHLNVDQQGTLLDITSDASEITQKEAPQASGAGLVLNTNNSKLI